MARRLWRGTGLGLVSGLLALGAGPALALELPGAGILRGKLEQALVAELGGSASIGGLAVRPISGELEVRDVVLHPGGGTVSRLVLRRALADVALSELIRGRLRLAALTVDGLEVALRPTAGPTASQRKPLDARLFERLERLSVKDGAFRYVDPDGSIGVEARGVEVASGPQHGTTLDGRLVVGALELTGAGFAPQRVDGATLRWSWQAPRLAFEIERVRGLAGELRGAGVLSLGATGLLLRGSLDGMVELGAILTAPALAARGPVSLRATFRVADRGQAMVGGELVGTTGIELGGAQLLGAAATFRYDRAGFELSRGRATTPRGSRVEDLMLRSEGRGGLTLRAVADAEVQDLLELARAGRRASLLRGRARCTLALVRQPGPGALRWEVAADLDSAGLQRGALAGRVEGAGGPEGGRATLRGALDEAPVEATLSWGPDGPAAQWEVDARFEAPPGAAALALRDDLERWLADEGVILPRGTIPLPGGGGSGRVHLEAREGRVVHGEVPFVWLRPTFGATQLALLEGRVELGLGQWRVAVRLADEQGHGLVSALAGAGNAPVRIDGQADRLPLAVVREYLVEAFKAGLPALDGELSGVVSGRHAHGRLELFIAAQAQGRLGAAPPATVQVSGRVLGDQAAIATATVTAHGLAAHVQGALDLPGAARPGRFQGRVEADVDLPELAELIGAPASAGRASFRGDVTFAGIDQPLIAAGALSWVGLSVGGAAAPDGSAEVEALGDGLAVHARGATWQADAQLLDRLKDPRLALRFAWTDIELSRLFSSASGVSPPLALDLSSAGKLTLSGPLAKPSEWRGEGVVSRLDLATTSFAAYLGGPTTLELLPGGRLRTVPASPLTIVGPAGGRLALEGEIGCLGAAAGRLALRAEGQGDLRVLEALDPDLLVSGQVSAQVTVAGELGALRWSGAARISDGRVRLLPYADAVDRLEADIAFGPPGLTISRGAFRLGGGDVSFGGVLGLEDFGLGRFDIGFSARDVALHIPLGLWGRYNAEVKLTGPAAEPEVQGEVTMLAGRWTAPFPVEALSGARTRKLAPATSRSHWTTRVGLRLRLSAADTLAVRNDMGALATRLQAGLGLEISGDLARPQLAGAIVAVEGGRFTFRNIEYEIDSGRVTLDDPRSEPARVQLRATTEIRGHRIRLDLDASSEMFDYQLYSTPALSRNQILALLITGRAPDESLGAAVADPTELATSYFGAQLGEMLLARPVKSLIGVDRFQIAPSVVGPDARPTARVTLGRRVDDKTSVVYSRDLSAEGADLYWIERDLSRELRAVLGREELGGVGATVRWLHRVGERAGAEPQVHAPTPRLSDVQIRGAPSGVKIRLRRDLGLAVGRRAPRFQLIEAREALRLLLAEAGWLEARVRAELQQAPAPGGATRFVAVFDVEAGPLWTVRYEGPPSATSRAREVLTELWGGTAFGLDTLREAVRVVREALADEGFAAAAVDVRQPTPGVRELVVTVDPGPRVTVEEVAFRGAETLSEKELQGQVLLRSPSVLPAAAPEYRPRVAAADADAIRTLYGAHGRLEAQVTPQVRLRGDGEAAAVLFVIEEGPLAKVGVVRVEGDWPTELGPATARLALHAGQPFTPAALDRAETALHEALDEAGWWQARVVARPEVSAGVVDVTFRVQAGRRAVIEAVRVEGLEATRRRIVDRLIDVHAGARLSSGALRRTERELFRLGLFRKVEIETAPVGEDPGRRIVTIRVQEDPHRTLLSSLGYDTEERWRASIGLTHDNLWGVGRLGGVQLFGSGLRRGARATLEDRRLARGALEGLLTVGVEREDRNGFRLQTIGGALQVGSPLRRETRWQLRCVLEDNRYADVTLDPRAIEETLKQERLAPVRLGGALGSVILDRRDDPFLPTRGWTAQSELGLWTPLLASQETFLVWTGQLAAYRTRSRLTLAGSSRFGLTWPLADTRAAPISRRFFAGGADSLRGFSRDQVGPVDEFGNPLGGEALLITNVEARYRFWGGLAALAFYDVGNVWLKARELYDGDLRKAAGLGLRYETPFGALRLEYGWKLDRRPGESAGEFFLSIGEPF